VLTPRSLDWAVDEAIQQRLISADALRRTAARARGRRGAGALKRAAERHRPTGITRSRLEQRFKALIRAAQLPEPLTNVKLHGVEVDAYWPDSRLVVELDSYRYHRTRPKFEHDSSKGAKLVAAGLAVMRVTWWQLEDESYAVVARAAQALTRGALH
jgi:very-short-patch-repair endonuclease